ncbi:MAG TPA: YdjY domain-containing protein [Chthoniobacteraceae bacterium]|nr:YdjY domain-containing protein [Chthoniobacteraceae bacterium]
MNSSSLLRLICMIAVALASGTSSPAQEPAPESAQPMQEISPGVLQMGQLRLDQNRRAVSFPGRLNLAEGALEYLLVTPEGSTHESLLTTEIQPADLHFAMLLLGARGAGILAPAPEDAPPEQINKEYLARAPRLQGDNVLITVKWKVDAAEKSVPVEDWLMNSETRKPAPRGPWLYTGSMFRDGKFLAQTEGVFGALVTFPSALINNPRKGNDNDLLWAVNAKAVPAVATPVEITIQLPPAPPAAKEP